MDMFLKQCCVALIAWNTIMKLVLCSKCRAGQRFVRHKPSQAINLMVLATVTTTKGNSKQQPQERRRQNQLQLPSAATQQWETARPHTLEHTHFGTYTHRPVTHKPLNTQLKTTQMC